MKFRHLSFLIFLSGFFALSATKVIAQNERATSGINIDLESSVEGIFYQDPFSTIAPQNLMSLENLLDLESYVLGPGDFLSVSIDAVKPILLRGLIINPEGKIVSPLLGQIYLQGSTLAEALVIVKEKVANVLVDASVEISLESPRSISIFVNGDVPYAGKHTALPFSRLDQAIYPALKAVEIDPVTKLPVLLRSTSDILNSGDYSFRNIKIIKASGDTTIADLHAFYKAGSIIDNPVLQDGDRIQIDKLTNDSQKISISGAVVNSLELEYNALDTPQKLIDLAGGLRDNANKEYLLVYRANENRINKIEVPNSEWNTLELYPNDRLVLARTSGYNINSVAHIFGEVNLPGTFPIYSGETSAFDLIELANGLTSNSLRSAAYLIRGSKIENQVRNEFNLESLKRTSDQLSQGFEYLDLETKNSQNRVFLNLDNEDELKTIMLFNGDHLYVPVDEQTIFVFGQVNTPGFYPFSEVSSVSNYIDRAGGFALSADMERIFILKAGSNTWHKPSQTTLESGDKIFVDRVPYDELNSLRNYEVQKQQIRNTRIQLIMTGITTITGIITTYVAIRRL